MRLMLKELRRRHASWAALARAMGVTGKAIEHARDRQRNVTTAVALRVARAANMPLEAVISGTWRDSAIPCCSSCGQPLRT